MTCQFNIGTAGACFIGFMGLCTWTGAAAWSLGVLVAGGAFAVPWFPVVWGAILIALGWILYLGGTDVEEKTVEHFAHHTKMGCTREEWRIIQEAARKLGLGCGADAHAVCEAIFFDPSKVTVTTLAADLESRKMHKQHPFAEIP